MKDSKRGREVNAYNKLIKERNKMKLTFEI